MPISPEEKALKALVIVIDEVACECLYVDGKAWKDSRDRVDSVVSAKDIVAAAEGQPVTIACQHIDFIHFWWPNALADATTFTQDTRI